MVEGEAGERKAAREKRRWVVEGEAGEMRARREVVKSGRINKSNDLNQQSTADGKTGKEESVKPEGMGLGFMVAFLFLGESVIRHVSFTVLYRLLSRKRCL